MNYYTSEGGGMSDTDWSSPAASATPLAPRLSVSTPPVDQVFLSPDGSTVAGWTAPDDSGNSLVAFWLAWTGAPLGHVAVGADAGMVMCGNWSFGACHDWRYGGIRVWRPGSGQILGDLNPHGAGRGVYDLALSERGELGASLGADGTIALWRPADGSVVTTFSPTARIDLPACALTLSADARLVAVRTDTDMLELWTTDSPQLLDSVSGTGPPVISADSRWLAVQAAGAATLYDLATGSPAIPLAPGSPIAFTPDGSLFLLRTPEGTVSAWLTSPVQPYGGLPGQPPQALSGDGRCLAVAGADGITLFDVATGHPLALLAAGGGVGDLAISADGRTLVASCADPAVHVWTIG